MMKRTIFAVMGLAFVLALASPPRAHAGVVIGIGVGPVFVPRPAYGYVVHPRPYAYPYGYAPAYAPPAYGYYGHYDRDRYWDRRDRDRREWNHRDRDDREWRDRR